MKFKIGVFEDNEEEIDKLIRVLHEYKRINKVDYDIVEFYDEKSIKDNGLGKINLEIIDSINRGEIQSLILDYKILSESERITGSDIHQLVHDHVIEFPIILLTEKKSECIMHENIDPDKVYEKKYFFDIGTENSNKYIANLYRNMERYINIKNKLKVDLKRSQRALVDIEYTEETVSKILDLEKRLGYYEESDQTEFDKLFDPSSFNEIIELIEKAEEMEKDKNETKKL